MDATTLERLAEFICGDDLSFAPVYRTGSELTRFFHRVGLYKFNHDGSTRKWWTLNVLQSLTSTELYLVLQRLASPKEYAGNAEQVKLALESLNRMLTVEGLMIELNGIVPNIKTIAANFVINDKEDENSKLKPLPPPDFYSLAIEYSIATILEERWAEVERCVKAEAYLAGIIVMGSLLEGLILSVMQRKPAEANQSKVAPKDANGKVKRFHQWSLSEMIDVAHNEGWFDLDVKLFSHALRTFRNLIHPYEQMMLQVFPDEDTCNICWLVVQAAVNDLAKELYSNK